MAANDAYQTARERLVAEIAAEAALTAGYTGRVRFSAAVMDAVARVPRHEFVPAPIREYAYLNRPLPIGAGKTVSQPYIVALMTDVLNPAVTDHVLEVGSGAGYQAAVLSLLVERVHTIELIEELAADARRRLAALRYANVEVVTGNGYYGLPAHAPYDKILVTAACELVPAPLIAQLKPRGRMVIPTGTTAGQSLTLVTKDASGVISLRDLLPVRFSELDEPGAPGGSA